MLKKLAIRVGLPAAVVGGFIIGHLDIQDYSPHPAPPSSITTEHYQLAPSSLHMDRSNGPEYATSTDDH